VIGARWNVGVESAESTRRGLAAVAPHWLPERRRGYFADPFPGHRDGVTAVLVEEFDERQGTGTISAVVREGDRWTTSSCVIDPGVHASYPFLVEDGGSLYCVPETARAGCVQAWRCARFPDEWRADFTVVDAPVIDPTLVRWEGRWWMFGTLRGPESNASLRIWSADELHGPWAAHPLNPVKTDVSSARSGGTPFVVDGTLYRPAQDCSRGYGGSVVVNRVDRLDLTAFSECPVATLAVSTGRYPAGSHTLSRGGSLVAVDGKRHVVSLWRTAREIRARLRTRR
jgi:hypothetical protein